MMRRAALVALVLLALAAPGASATFHEVSIREVYPGSVAQPDSEYVELQMWSAGQHLIAGHTITTYDASGTEVESTVFPGDVGSGANQSTILLASAAAASQFGVSADAAMDPGQLSPGGGAVCWESLDCVAWGSFKGSLSSPVGPPAAPGGVPDGMALRRTIAPGCASLLEPSDDRNNSATDFSAVFPAPRPNSTPPSERPCDSSAGPQGGYGPRGRGAPQTRLRRKPAKRSADRTPTFRFAANERDVTFQCKLDSRAFRRCQSPFTTGQLAPGRHVFRVRARDASGKLDPSPATYRFTVLAGS